MMSGRRLDLSEPAFTDIEPSDIALGLSRVARWNGQTSGDYPYTVAQHCMWVDDLIRKEKPRIEKKWRLAALLHDASEYVTGDIISPFKNLLGDPYARAEEIISHAVHRRFGIPIPLPDAINSLIHKADKKSAFVEAVHLAGFSEEEARRFIWKDAPKNILKDQIPLVSQPPEEVRKAFLLRLRLCGARDHE
jgi:hypothetical protein